MRDTRRSRSHMRLTHLPLQVDRMRELCHLHHMDLPGRIMTSGSICPRPVSLRPYLIWHLSAQQARRRWHLEYRLPILRRTARSNSGSCQRFSQEQRVPLVVHQGSLAVQAIADQAVRTLIQLETQVQA